MMTVTRSDGCAQYHIIEFQSTCDILNAQTARLLEREVLSLDLGMSLDEALQDLVLMETAIDSALAERRTVQMRRLRNNGKRSIDARRISSAVASDVSRPSSTSAAASVPVSFDTAKAAVTSYGSLSAIERERLKEAKAHMAAAAAARAVSYYRSSPADRTRQSKEPRQQTSEDQQGTNRRPSSAALAASA